MSNFLEYFYKLDNTDFEISKRGGLNLEKIVNKVKENKIEKIIIDISINGYTNKENFDFEVEGKKWSETKNVFIKGIEAQKDNEALTIKRAIRVCSQATTEYIQKKKINLPLLKYNIKLNPIYAHLGGHFVVPLEEANQIVLLWESFDKVKHTTIAETVKKILKFRFSQDF